MRKVLRLLGMLSQIVKSALRATDFVGTITTAAADLLPALRNNNEALPFAISFAEQADKKVIDGQTSSSNNQYANNNTLTPHVNDELAKEERPTSSWQRPGWFVNDDLAACVANTINIIRHHFSYKQPSFILIRQRS